MQIRHAVPADREPVLAFVLATLWSHGLRDDHDDLRVFAVPFNGALAELVAVQGGDVIGMATLWPRGPRLGWLSKLFVDPAHRGQGAGRALLGGIEEEARSWGLSTIGLTTLPILRDAIRLYERAGWIRRPGPRGERTYYRDLTSAV
jgi:GNAT superfamily N-acetyltransferase